MTKVKLIVVDDQIQEQINKMITRGANAQPFLKRVVYPIYMNAQRARWMTENRSQGKKWKPLNTEYAAYKLKRYGGGPRYEWIGGSNKKNAEKKERPWKLVGTWPTYKGAGKKTMIATGALVDSVTGEDKKYHRSIVRKSEIIVATTLDYAASAAEERPFMDFNKKFYQGLNKRWMRYVSSGDVGGKK
jgi:hypothetical protein